MEAAEDVAVPDVDVDVDVDVAEGTTALAPTAHPIKISVQT